MTRREMVTSKIACVVFCIVCFAVIAAGTESTAADLVAGMPAQNAAEFETFGAGFVQLGAAGIQEVCNMLVAPGSGDDANARFALSGLAKYVSRPGAEAERTMVAGALIEALATAAEPEVKAFLVRQLQVAGKDESVAPLSGYLADDLLCEPATQALLAIGTPEATTALATALPSAQGKNRATIVKALGELRCVAAVGEIAKSATAEDTDTRHTALWALANIGDPASGEILSKATETASPYERAKALSWRLLYARRLSEAGKNAECEAVCRQLLEAPEANVQSAALHTLVAIKGEAALDDLLAAMDSASKDVRGAALRFAPAIPGEGATAKWVEKMAGASPEVRLEIMTMLGQRGDTSALPALLAALKADDKAVRLTAIDAATRLDGQAATSALLAGLVTAVEEDEVKATKEALLRVGGDQVVPAVADAVTGVPVLSRVALVEVLAARRAEAHIEVVFARTKDEDPSVRVAATKALGDLANEAHLPRLVDLVLAAQSDAERSAAQNVVVSVAKQVAAPEQRAESVLAALANATGAQRAYLLPILPGVGGKRALDVVAADTQSADAAVKDAAVRALADWPDASAAEALIAVAKGDEDLKHQVLALQGYVRLTGAGSFSAEDKLRMLADAMAVAKRTEEKRLVLSSLADVRSAEALAYVADYLEDEELRTDAALAAVKIACPQNENDQGLTGPAVALVLKKAVHAIENADVRRQVEAHLATTSLPGEFNVAQGKGVQTSVAQQGEHNPEFAVDGKTDLESGWWGETWPSWLQVDLGATTEVDSAHVFFYWDGARYYQYNLAVSTDGEQWTTVADAAANTTPGTERGVVHAFPPVQARYVRLNILKNSANEAVHLAELKVFAAGDTPPRQEATPATAQPQDTGEEGFVSLFNGSDLTGWIGDTKGYVVEGGSILCKPGGNLFTEKAYSDFIFRFEFKLTPGANNGLGIRTEPGTHAAYQGMELQILDDTAEKYAKLQPYQYHGSIYGVVPAKRGHQKPVGEWNSEEVIAKGRQITVNLNGTTIVDANLDEASTPETMDHKAHPGLKRDSGHIGFLGHGSILEFRNIRVKELK